MSREQAAKRKEKKMAIHSNIANVNPLFAVLTDTFTTSDYDKYENVPSLSFLREHKIAVIDWVEYFEIQVPDYESDTTKPLTARRYHYVLDHDAYINYLRNEMKDTRRSISKRVKKAEEELQRAKAMERLLDDLEGIL